MFKSTGFFTPPDIPLAGYEPPVTDKYSSQSYPVAPPSAYAPYTPPAATYQSSVSQPKYPAQSKAENQSPAPYAHAGQYNQGYQQSQKHVSYAPKTVVQTKNVTQSHSNSVQKIQQKFNNPSPVSAGQSPTNYQQSKYQQQQPKYQYGGPASPAIAQAPYSSSPVNVSKPHYPPPQQQQHQQQYQSNGYGAYNSNASPLTVPQRAYTQSAPVSPRISLDLSSSKNYNNAALGWTQMRDYYRPIHLDGGHHGRKTALPYSDF